MVNYNNKAFQLAKYAVMFAVIFVAMMLDKVISLPLPFTTAICVSLVTLSFCFLENKWSTGILAGLFFGLASFIKEFMFPSPSWGNLPILYRLLITIPSRVLMSTLAFCTYRLMLCLTEKLNTERKRQITSITVAVFVGLVVNTFAFLSSVYLSLNIHDKLSGIVDAERKTILTMVYGALFTNILPEYTISLASVSFIVLGVRKGLKLGIEGNNWKLALKDEVTSVTGATANEYVSALQDNDTGKIVNGESSDNLDETIRDEDGTK